MPWVFDSDENISLIINNSAAHLPIVLKLGMLVHYDATQTGEL